MRGSHVTVSQTIDRDSERHAYMLYWYALSLSDIRPLVPR